MTESNLNKHLNLFHFFNSNETQYYENNLSRALALTLKSDHVFLDRILEWVLPQDLYKKSFKADNSESKLVIDIQKSINDLDSFGHVIAVSTTAEELSYEEVLELDRNTESPITDITIELNDILVIIEVKRTKEDCREQLLDQISSLSGDPEVFEKDLSWSKVMELASNVSSFQGQVGDVNHILSDFISFIKYKHADWLPTRRLEFIQFPENLENKNSPNFVQLEARLSDIKQEMGIGEISYDRNAISVDWGWATEFNIKLRKKDNIDYLAIICWAGDTKAQGKNLFGGNRKLNLLSEINGYEIEVQPYIKFAHFNSGRTRIWDLKPEEYNTTHTRSFFEQVAGRWWKEKWEDFNKLISEIIPDWKERCEWKGEFEEYDRNYFDLSLGIRTSLFVPYKNAQKLDSTRTREGKLADELRESANQLKEYIESDLFV